MSTRAQTRWLLLLTACTVFLIARDFRRADAGRFSVIPLRAGSPVLVRTDTSTGESWMLELRAGGERWVPIPDAGEGRAWSQAAAAPAPEAAPNEAEAPARALASDEIKALANAILGDELAPDIRVWAVGQLAATPDRRATTALIQLLDAVDDPQLVALIREALAQRDDPRARAALERHPEPGSAS